MLQIRLAHLTSPRRCVPPDSAMQDGLANYGTEKALDWLLHKRAGAKIPPPPSKERSRELMANYIAQPIPDVEFEFNYEELAFEDVPREVRWTDGKQPPAAKREAHKVLIIGAGINVRFAPLSLHAHSSCATGNLDGHSAQKARHPICDHRPIRQAWRDLVVSRSQYRSGLRLTLKAVSINTRTAEWM